MSGKNKLLQEATIRRFMKLANVDALSGNFLEGKYTRNDPESPDDDQPKEEGNDLGMEVDLLEQEEAEDELEMDAEMDVDPGAMDDMGDMDDMDDMDDMGAEEGTADVSLTEEEARLLVDLGERLAGALGEDTGDEAEDLDPGLDDEPAPEEAEEVEMGDIGAEEEEEEDPLAESKSKRDKLVNEVMKRVVEKIVSAKIANKRNRK